MHCQGDTCIIAEPSTQDTGACVLRKREERTHGIAKMEVGKFLNVYLLSLLFFPNIKIM